MLVKNKNKISSSTNIGQSRLKGKKNTIRSKEGYFIFRRGSIHEKDVMVLN